MGCWIIQIDSIPHTCRLDFITGGCEERNAELGCLGLDGWGWWSCQSGGCDREEGDILSTPIGEPS